MVRIRLRRVGSKKQPSYRIVVTDSHSPRDGRFIERIGFYNPRTQPATVRLDEPRALYWLSVGAQPSDAVRHMMDKAGTIGRYDRLRKGETMEALVTEAQAIEVPKIDPRTRRDDLIPHPKKPKAKAEAKATASTEAVAEPAAEPVAEAAAEPIAEAAAEPVAEAAAEPDAELAAEPIAEAAAEPDAEPAAETAVEPASEAPGEGETETPAE
jgi:small subunit ribosomal protein S16